MFKAKLKAVYQDLTQSEKLVADYILEHIDEIRTITSHQLAVNTHIGQSTIIRFSQKLGYNSFRELSGRSVSDPAAGSGPRGNSGQRINDRY